MGGLTHNCSRPDGKIGFVGVPHGVQLDRRLMDLVLDRTIGPGWVFDLELPLADVAEGYGAMDERRAISSGSNWTSARRCYCGTRTHSPVHEREI
ncbi:hypothetical protein AJ87_39505 [Rhizobium yanglingense]|nr:hypothetical protein AJ87_39505 [Rhizobium yanglingense]